MDGFINFLKPPGMTSSDAVVMVRRMLPRGTRVGHGGTLDPDAAGVLPICVGRAARLFDYIIDKKKVYLAELRLGVSTDTQDSTGAVTRVRPVTVGEPELRTALHALVGEIDQIPPSYSAIKQGGKRMYQLARAGQASELPPRRVRVYAMEYLCSPAPDAYLIRISCGKGVYIRTLCHDLGEMLNCGGHMAFLLRTSAGYFDIDRAVTPEELSAAREAGSLASILAPMDAPIAHLPAVLLGESHRRAALNGNPLPDEGNAPAGVPLRMYIGEEFAGIGEKSPDGEIRFRAMLMEKDA